MRNILRLNITEYTQYVNTNTSYLSRSLPIYSMEKEKIV